VRRLLGYGRLDSRKMESLINETYRDWALRDYVSPPGAG